MWFTPPLYVRAFYLGRQAFISEVCQQLAGLCVQTSVQNVHEQGRLLQVLQVDVIDVPNISQAVVLRVLNVQYAVDHLTLRHWNKRRGVLHNRLTFCEVTVDQTSRVSHPT